MAGEGGKQEHMAQGYLRVFHGLAVLCSPKPVDMQVSCLVNTFELQCAFTTYLTVSSSISNVLIATGCNKWDGKLQTLC